MNYTFTKSEKKLVRQLLDKGLERDYINGINKIKALLDQWEKSQQNPRETYLNMYKTLDKHDRNLSRKFDGLTGGRYFMALVDLMIEGLVSEEEIEGLSKETKERIYFLLGKDME
ncbi:hypothetical protein RCC89_12385 [Cytophagaceae bacterium ABcell3]|nr:hypothetical protein RCC89_12385 [Cytophagaceae bacterium ABcell3]